MGIAKNCDVRQRYLIEKFKRAHGTTQHKYINSKRMREKQKNIPDSFVPICPNTLIITQHIGVCQ